MLYYTYKIKGGYPMAIMTKTLAVIMTPEIRAQILFQLDTYLRESLYDEDLFDRWLEEGVPDGTESWEELTDIEAEDFVQATALIIAASKGHKEVVELLLGDAAYINKTSKWGSALVEASENGHKEVVELLIKKGADMERKNENDETALFRAAYNGHKDVVELLIDNGALLETKNNAEETALLASVWNGHKDVAELLIDRGAEIDVENKFGHTIWKIVDREGHKEIADMLLAKGVTRQEEKQEEKQEKKPEVKEDKKQKRKQKENESLKAVSELAEALGKINEKPKVNSDRADLISMVKKGDVKQVKKLLERGADVTKKDELGKTAIDYAYEKNNVLLAGILYVAERRKREENTVKYPMVVYKKDNGGISF